MLCQDICICVNISIEGVSYGKGNHNQKQALNDFCHISFMLISPKGEHMSGKLGFIILPTSKVRQEDTVSKIKKKT